MGELLKLRSSSSPHLPFTSVCLLVICLCVLSNSKNVEGGLGSVLLDGLLPAGFGGFISTNIFGIRSRRQLLLNVNDHGASGDGVTDDTQVFKDAWDIACSSLSPQSEILFPAGHSYLVGPVNISGHCRSKITLRISGTIVAPNDPEVWDGLDPHKWLYFHNLKYLTVEGGGKVNGMGQEWWARSCMINKTNLCTHAPTALTFHRCNKLTVRNLEVVNSQQMHIAFTNCINVKASHLRVEAPAHSPNTDGIHISASTDVQVKESIIGTGDDCISIVSNSSGIRINNIACGPGHGISWKLGKGGHVDVHDVRIRGAVLSNTENGVRIKTWQGGSGFASKITFQDVWMENVSNPIIVDQYYCDSPVPCENKTSAVVVVHISFISIKGLACSDDYPCKGLYLEDVQLVSNSGGYTTSFCWQARGSSSGFVYPPPCFSSTGSFVQNIISSTFFRQYI